MKYRNILITGGAGKLGRIVCEHLEKQGYNVTLFDQATPREAVPPWDQECKALFIKGSLNDLGDCMRAIVHSEADVIIHLAALPHDSDVSKSRSMGRRNIQNVPEDTTMKSNVMGTYYLFDAARRLKIKKIICASSFFTLGCGFRVSNKQFQVDYLPLDELHESRPEDTYSMSKHLNEEMMKSYARSYDIKFVALRFLGVVFPFRPVSMVSIADIKKQQARNNELGVSDFNVYQYVDARDIANACELAIEKDLDSGFEAFFLSTGSNCYDAAPAEIVAAIRPDLAEMAKNIPEGEDIISYKKIKETYGYKPMYFMEKPASSV